LLVICDETLNWKLFLLLLWRTYLNI
jgi:hypothetical protein